MAHELQRSTQTAGTRKDAEEIENLLQAYRDGLARSSVSEIAKLYTSDALLLAQGFPIMNGRDNIEKWYTEAFKLIHLDVTFDIKEVVVTSDEYAFASTTSTGTVVDQKSGEKAPEGNHELFVLQKVNGTWAIARYCFSTASGA